MKLMNLIQALFPDWQDCQDDQENVKETLKEVKQTGNEGAEKKDTLEESPLLDLQTHNYQASGKQRDTHERTQENVANNKCSNC